MEDLSQAMPAAPVATARWILGHAVSMTIPGLGMELTRQSRVELRRFDGACWLLGPDAHHHLRLLFEKDEAAATFVGFALPGHSPLITQLRSLGIMPDTIMPDGQRRYGSDAIYQLHRQSEKLDAPGQGV